MNQYSLTRIAALVCSASLIACGGGGNPAASPAPQAGPVAATTISDAPVVVTTGPDTAARKPLVAPPTTGVPVPVAGTVAITDIKLQSTGAAEQRSVPVTFGQPFGKGQLLTGQTLTGRLTDGSNVALQVDVKASHADGSVRHAVVSAFMPVLAAQATQGIEMLATASPAATAPVGPGTLLQAGFSSTVNVVLGGQRYSASPVEQLRLGKYTTWLSGPIVNEWQVSAPLTTADGIVHPHLTARYAIRAYRGNTRARVDVTIENDWAYEPSPQNFVYDVQMLVGGAEVYSRRAFNHAHHSRYRKVFWWGEEPMVHLKHNTSYLIATRAVPNYDQSLVFADTTLDKLRASFVPEPMTSGVATAYMAATGGRPDLGLLPSWGATYLLTMDKRAKDVTLGMGDLGGSWSSHYRNKNTDRPISLLEYPYMTLLGNPGDTYNPATQKLEYFPPCAAGASCVNSNVHDSAHQPGFAYLPYLVTGDYYYLEELQFWAMWNTFSDNPGYRDNIKGLLKPDQVRGQAWSMRTLSQAAYITPDADPLKSHLQTFLSNNLDWYNANYSNNASANKLGVIVNGYAVVYGEQIGIAPWQDDFFTAAIGYANDLGFEKAAPLLRYKSKFLISRMTDPGVCWIDAAIYAMKVRDSNTSPFYSTMLEAYTASHTPEFNALTCASTAMAASLGLKVGQMTGYSDVDTGYPSNMQPALAYSADVSGAQGKTAWNLFMSRSVKPNYSLGPQFAVVPRN